MTAISHQANGLESTLEKVSRSLSERFGIRVICQGNRCCTDGKVIYLPSLPDDIPKELMQVIRGWLDHEVSHHTEKSDMKVGAEFKARLGPDAFFLLNILEDLRVEEGIRQRFPGSGYNLARCYEFAVAEAGKGDALPPLRQLAFAIHTRVNQQPDLAFVEPEIYAAADQIEMMVAQVSKCTNTKQVAELAEKAWRILEPLLARPKGAPQSQPPEGSTDSGGGSERKCFSRESASGQTPSSPSPGDGTSSATVSTDHSNNNHTGTDHFHGILGDLGDAIAGQVQRYADSHQSYRVWTTNRDRVTVATAASMRTHQERMASILPHVAGVRQRLLQTLQAEPKARWRGDLKEGSINPRALHRLVCPEPNRDGSSRVFRQRVRTKKLRTAVMLLIDESNSMRHGRLQLAGGTALVFCEALSRLNIATSVIGFSTGSSDTVMKDARAQTGLPEDEIKRRYRTIPLSHTVYKRFDEVFTKVSGRMDSMVAKSLTPLGESMLFAARELAARHEERKVLFVLTDGKPVVGIEPEDVTFSHAKAVIKRIEDAGIDVALLGIMEPSVALLHHRAVVINRLDDLPRTAMRQLQAVLAK